MDLAEVAAQAVQAAEPRAAGLAIELVLETEVAPHVQGDRDRLGQALDNRRTVADAARPERRWFDR